MLLIKKKNLTDKKNIIFRNILSENYDYILIGD